MSNINNLITPRNIQGELIKNEIEQNNLMIEAVKEQKYNELLKENQKLKIEISARETVCDELQERINKTVEYIESKNNGVCVVNGVEKGAYTFVLDFDKTREFIWELLDLLKGDKE